MSNVTFIFFTFNEEKRIPFVIRNFIKYGRVVILDGGSTDNTKEVAEKLGADFFIRPASLKPQVETQDNFNFIKTIVNTDWIYWGYVDNLARRSLVEKLIEISTQDKIKMVLVPIYTYLWGNIDNIASKGYTPIFFHKDFIDFSDNYIHGMGKFLGRKDQILKLPNKTEYAISHFSVYNINKFIQNHLRYAETEALEKYKIGKKFNILVMFAGMVRYAYIYRRSLSSGITGIIVILSYVFFRLMAYARLYELEQGITLESIEDNYVVSKGKILQDFDQ